MVYADEIVAPTEVELFDGLDEVELKENELAMARQLVSSLEADFEPTKHTDTYRLAVLGLIDRKVAGEETVFVAPSDDEVGSVVDLMAALEASVAEAKKARTRHPTASEKKPAAKKTSAKKKTAAKRTAAKKTVKKAS